MKGHPEIPTCPKCHECGPAIEVVLQGRFATVHFCNSCAHEWKTSREPSTDVSGVLIDGP